MKGGGECKLLVLYFMGDNILPRPCYSLHLYVMYVRFLTSLLQPFIPLLTPPPVQIEMERKMFIVFFVKF